MFIGWLRHSLVVPTLACCTLYNKSSSFDVDMRLNKDTSGYVKPAAARTLSATKAAGAWAPLPPAAVPVPVAHAGFGTLLRRCSQGGECSGHCRRARHCLN